MSDSKVGIYVPSSEWPLQYNPGNVYNYKPSSLKGHVTWAPWAFLQSILARRAEMGPETGTGKELRRDLISLDQKTRAEEREPQAVSGSNILNLAAFTRTGSWPRM